MKDVFLIDSSSYQYPVSHALTTNVIGTIIPMPLQTIVIYSGLHIAQPPMIESFATLCWFIFDFDSKLLSEHDIIRLAIRIATKVVIHGAFLIVIRL